MEQNNIFWLQDLSVLFTKIELFPTQDMHPNRKLNAITRLLLAVCIGLYVYQYKYTSTIFIVGLAVIVAVYYLKLDYVPSNNISEIQQYSPESDYKFIDSELINPQPPQQQYVSRSNIDIITGNEMLPSLETAKMAVLSYMDDSSIDTRTSLIKGFSDKFARERKGYC
jgi:hypothetical protein